MLKLANYVSVCKYQNKGVFGIGSKQLIFENIEDWGKLVCVASMWTEPCSYKQLLQKVLNKYIHITEKEISKAYKVLMDNDFLMEEINLDYINRYSRNNLYYSLVGANPLAVQKRLKHSTVAVIGCGGIGNYVSYMLTTMGVGKIILVDDDKVELSNLTRQFLFSEKDVGFSKISILQRELLKRNSGISIAKYPLKIKSEKDLYKIKENVNLFVLSADTPSDIIYWMNRYAVKKMVAYLNVGYFNDISVVGPFVIPQKPPVLNVTKLVLIKVKTEINI